MNMNDIQMQNRLTHDFHFLTFFFRFFSFLLMIAVVCHFAMDRLILLMHTVFTKQKLINDMEWFHTMCQNPEFYDRMSDYSNVCTHNRIVQTSFGSILMESAIEVMHTEYKIVDTALFNYRLSSSSFFVLLVFLYIIFLSIVYLRDRFSDPAEHSLYSMTNHPIANCYINNRTYIIPIAYENKTRGKLLV